MISRSTDIKSALRSRQRGFLLNPNRFTPPPPAGDPHWASVVLLLKGNGADGSTVFADSSSSAKSSTLVGNARVRTAQSKFDGSSLYFDGSGDYAYTGSSTDFYFPGDFTIEAWVFHTTTGTKYIFGNWVAGNSYPYQLGINGSHLPLCTLNGGGLVLNGAGTALAMNTWNHIAVSRTGTAVKLHANGVQYASGTYGTAVGPAGGFPVYVGAIRTDLISAEVYADEIRITKGVGRYPAAFTPPIEAFPTSL